MLEKFKKVKFITVCSRIGLTVLLYKIINFFYRCSEKRIFFLGGLLAKISRLIIFFGGLEASPRFEWHKVLHIILVIMNF